jgi:chromosome segregation ATPase
MTDETKTPDQPVEEEAQAPAQQEKSSEINLEKDFVPMERFSGAIQKIQSLTEEKNGLTQQLENKVSEMERLQLSLAEKEAGSTTLLGQRDQTIGELNNQISTLQEDLSKAQIDMKKVQIAKEIGAPELIQILDTIPSVSDEEQLKNMMKNIAEFTTSQVTAREKELMAGATPQITSVDNVQTPFPEAGDADAWEQRLAKLDPGSKEWNDAMEHWRKGFSQ